MRGTLIQEYEIMLNPALGANAIWAFAHGYYSQSKQHRKNLTLWHLVTVLPLVYHDTSRKIINKRREGSGLRSILERDSVMGVSRNETIFNINRRIKALEKKTFDSIRLAVSCNLINVENGYFTSTLPFKVIKNTPNETREILKAAQKLGVWAGGLSDFEYLTILGVEPKE